MEVTFVLDLKDTQAVKRCSGERKWHAQRHSSIKDLDIFRELKELC